MNKLIYISLILLFFSSCITKEKCQRKYSPQIKTDSVYIVKEVVKYRDTTIYIKIKADTVFLSDTVILSDNGLIISDTVKSSLEYSYANSWVHNSKIHLQHIQKDSLIAKIIENAIKENSKVEYIEKKETKIETVAKFTWWSKLLMFLSIPTILYILIKFVRVFI